MNLHELRTPQPLHEADFAAIRARVQAEIAQREERSWLPILLRFAFAASLLVLFVPYVKDRVPDVPVQVVEREAPPVSSRASSEGPGRVARQARATRPSRPGPSLDARDDIAVNRIEIITEDPTIRIIWLTPKENNS